MQSDSLQYQLVYDAVQSTHLIWWSLLGISIAGATAAIIKYMKRDGVRDASSKRHTAMVIFVGCGLMLSVGSMMVKEYRMAAGLRTGRYIVVEGVVTDFHPGDEGDHVEESWEVVSNGRTHRFHYGPSSITPGFRRTQPHGGPIHAGLQVRIAEVDGHIARLEIAR